MRKILSVLIALLLLLSCMTVGSASPAQHGTIDPYSLSLQALQGKDGITDLYAKVIPKSSDILPPDRLKKLQLKSYIPEGKIVYAKNLFNIPARQGLANVKLDDVVRYQPLETKIHVKNAETVDEEVQEGKTTVLLRPDLTVDKVEATDQTSVNVPFAVTAYIKELNGDVGAKTNLHILDGSDVLDTAEGVVIDAGGQKQVVFMLKLPKPGTYTLKVNLSNIEPGDYDNTNNDKTFSVEVVENRKTVHYWSYYDHTSDYEHNVEYNWEDPYGSREYHDKQAFESFVASVYTPDQVDPKNISLTLASETGNQKTVNMTVSELGTWEGYTYWNGSDPLTHTWVWAYQKNSEGINIEIYQGTGYWSKNWRTYWENGSDYHSWGNGEFLGAKQSVSVQIDILSANDTHYGGNYSITLEPNSDSWDYVDVWLEGLPIHIWGYYNNYYGYADGITSW